MSSVEVTVYFGDERYTVEQELVDINRVNGNLLRPDVEQIEEAMDQAAVAVKAAIRARRGSLVP